MDRTGRPWSSCGATSPARSSPGTATRASGRSKNPGGRWRSSTSWTAACPGSSPPRPMAVSWGTRRRPESRRPTPAWASCSSTSCTCSHSTGSRGTRRGSWRRRWPMRRTCGRGESACWSSRRMRRRAACTNASVSWSETRSCASGGSIMRARGLELSPPRPSARGRVSPRGRGLAIARCIDPAAVLRWSKRPTQLGRRVKPCLTNSIECALIAGSRTPGLPCPTCGGERYIPARLDGKGHRRWRLRISTLMLLVAIAALMSAIVAGWWRRGEEARRRAALMERIVAEDRYFQAIKAKANARSPMPAPSVPTE